MKIFTKSQPYQIENQKIMAFFKKEVIFITSTSSIYYLALILTTIWLTQTTGSNTFPLFMLSVISIILVAALAKGTYEEHIKRAYKTKYLHWMIKLQEPLFLIAIIFIAIFLAITYLP